MGLLADGGSSFASNIGGILSGVSELLLAVGAGLGFLVRIRRNAKRERLRSEAAASLAAQETKKTLEAKLEQQHAAQIQQYKDQLVASEKAHEIQIDQLKAQILDLQRTNQNLLNRILEEPHD